MLYFKCLPHHCANNTALLSQANHKMPTCTVVSMTSQNRICFFPRIRAFKDSLLSAERVHCIQWLSSSGNGEGFSNKTSNMVAPAHTESLFAPCRETVPNQGAFGNKQPFCLRRQVSPRMAMEMCSWLACRLSAATRAWMQGASWLPSIDHVLLAKSRTFPQCGFEKILLFSLQPPFFVAVVAVVVF